LKERKNLRYQDITAIVDTREQNPLDLSPLNTITTGLKTGDYSVVGYEDKITAEVKALDDFIGCCTGERDRFERELVRMREYPWRIIVIKSDWAKIHLKQYRSRIVPMAVIGSMMSFAASTNVSIMMAGDHATAGILVSRFLWLAANHLHREKQLTPA
jgi:hypothetical protein